ncbi:MAG: hypothetical protein LKG27_07775, partial [Clostridiaceae bacterium]|nr:hypothetical protein [Clostridiaceae bacterium]
MNVDSKSSSTTRTVNAQNTILQKSVESLNRYSINSDFSFTRELQAAQNESSKKSEQTEISKEEKQSDTEKKADVTSSATNEKETKNVKSKDKVSSKSKTSETKKSESNEDKNKVSEKKEEEANNGEFAQVAGGVNYTDYKYGNKSQDLLSQNIKELYNTKDLINSNTNQNNSKVSSFQANSQFENTLDYSSINMSGEDAKFFVDLVNNTDKTMQGVTQELQSQMTSSTENIQGSSRVSKALLDTIQEGMKTNQPFRINFGKDVSVVL